MRKIFYTTELWCRLVTGNTLWVVSGGQCCCC